MLPEGWALRRLEDLATVERGKFSARPRNDPKFFGGNIPFVQTGDVTNSSIYVKNYSQTLNKEGLSVSKIFPKGTILMTIAANIGDTAIASFDLACPDSLVGIIAKKNKADAYWLRIFLGTQKTTLENYAPQNAQKNINLQTLKPLEILTPPLSEQKKIAAILSTWDRAIEGTEKLLANSQQQKKSLMQQLLTGKKRLPGFSGEWKKVSLEKTGKIVSGGTPDTTVPAYWDGDVLWLTPTDVTSLRGKYVEDTKRKITQAGIKDSATTLLPAGSLLVCTRATIGYMAIAKKPITTNQGFKNIVFNKLFLPEFVYYFLCTQKHEMQRLASGSTFAEISKKDFCKIHISAPPLPEQKAIAVVLTTADEEITALESDLSRLRQEKKALMQQLLTGKRRVRVN
ncbi:restriction endonuclease subunit S [Novacetimonas pomaceti]|uniref:Restriction endonuclease subunit S n=1 Tax=Novacetimonas pomaceti TaxID=2021998 RepID=A0ABX5NYM0_9PROT|nr:restriction endonuclease subunit S [Novacetimonas pomaceti]PYD46582.1 restriction endonuclease subunit S [Novacetimonas pomaceti]